MSLFQAQSHNYLSSDSDFEDTQKVTRKRKRITSTLNCESDSDTQSTNINPFGKHPESNSTSISNDSDEYSPTMPLNWEQLPADIQSVLPNDEEYSYVIQAHQKQDTKAFKGAPEFAFSAIIRINLDTPEAIKTWQKNDGNKFVYIQGDQRRAQTSRQAHTL